MNLIEVGQISRINFNIRQLTEGIQRFRI